MKRTSSLWFALFLICATPLLSMAADPAADKAAAMYGIPAVRVDGNNVLEVREAAETAVKLARSGGGPTR